jgi:hypothetical protein
VLVERPDAAINPPFGYIETTPAGLEQYGIEPETAAHFNVRAIRLPDGRSELVVPVHNHDGNLVGHTALPPGQGGRGAKVIRDLDATRELFNMHRVLEFCRLRYGNPEVVLVQTVLDCIKVHQASVETVVGLLDDSLSPVQENLLASYFGNVTIMMRPDRHGRKLAEAIAARLQRTVFVRVVSPPSEKLFSELSGDEIRDLLLS